MMIASGRAPAVVEMSCLVVLIAGKAYQPALSAATTSAGRKRMMESAAWRTPSGMNDAKFLRLATAVTLAMRLAPPCGHGGHVGLAPLAVARSLVRGNVHWLGADGLGAIQRRVRALFREGIALDRGTVGDLGPVELDQLLGAVADAE